MHIIFLLSQLASSRADDVKSRTQKTVLCPIQELLEEEETVLTSHVTNDTVSIQIVYEDARATYCWGVLFNQSEGVFYLLQWIGNITISGFHTFENKDKRPTQLLNATSIEGGIHDCQVLRY